MYALVIDDESKAAAQKLADFAAEKENWYRPGDDWFPGQKPEYTLVLSDHYRVCFSWTADPSNEFVYRHLTMSVPGDKMPHPVAVFTIARMLGFTGTEDEVVTNPPENWIVGVHPYEEGVIIVAEPIEGVKP